MPGTPIQLYFSNYSASQNNPNARIGDVGFGSGTAGEGGALALTNSLAITTTWGWNVGTLAAPRWCQMDFGTEVSRTSTTPAWQATIRPALVPPVPTYGDYWVYGPLEGEFEDGPWYVTQSYRSVSLAGTQLGRPVFVIWRADNQQGSGSVMLSASYVTSASVAVTESLVFTSITPSMAATTTQNRCTQSFTLGRQVFRRQFLIFQNYWNITTAGGGNNCDADWILHPNSASITTAKFIPYAMSPIIHKSDDFG